VLTVEIVLFLKSDFFFISGYKNTEIFKGAHFYLSTKGGELLTTKRVSARTILLISLSGARIFRVPCVLFMKHSPAAIKVKSLFRSYGTELPLVLPTGTIVPF
jgi:hypothetical protein